MKILRLFANKKVILILLVLGIVSSVVWYVVFHIVLFRVVSISPDPSRFPTSSTSLTLTFTKKLDESKVPQVSSKDVSFGSFVVSDKTLTIQLIDPLSENQRVSISVTNVLSATGETTSHDFVLVGKYVNFSDLSPEEQGRQIQQSDSFSSYVLIENLPITTATYDLTYLFPDSGETKMPLYITVKSPYPTPDDSSSSTEQAEYASFIKKAQEEAYTAIITLPGYVEKDYQIYYSEPMLGENIKGLYNDPMEEYEEIY